MQTIRTISNISYNTRDFFAQTINDLLDRGIIDWAYWIYHKAEVDELKDHIHFVLKPSKRLNTSDLQKAFNEFDPTNAKPLSCTARWNTVNSMDDWLLYAVHNQAYLTSKGQYRKYTYPWSDIETTDREALQEDIHGIDMMKYNRLAWLEDAVLSNVPFYKLVQDGVVPIPQRAQYEAQYYAIQRGIEYAQQHKTGRKQQHEVAEKPTLQEAENLEDPFPDKYDKQVQIDEIDN